VVRRLINRGRELGYDTLYIGDIYSFNTASRRCFEALGFRPYAKTELGDKYVLKLCGTPID
jgi:L-amino acid N-acyltransferase YncA